MSNHHDNSESFWSFMTGIVVQVAGMITFETFWVPLLLAFAGGFLGLIGKRLGEMAIGRIKAFWHRRKTRKNGK
jgi:hypothetical protein